MAARFCLFCRSSLAAEVQNLPQTEAFITVGCVRIALIDDLDWPQMCLASASSRPRVFLKL